MDKKIVIEITDAQKPPKVTVGGKEIEVADIEYYYETESNIHCGEHGLLVSYSNNEKNQFDKIGFEK